MEIVVQKTDFYLNDDFFNNIITQPYINGIAFNIVFNIEDKILVYNYTTSESYAVQRIQKFPIQQLETSEVLTLEEALSKIRINRGDIPIYLNLIPISISIVDDASLKQLIKINQEYVLELKKILTKFNNLKIYAHSASRNLALLLQKELGFENTGIFIYAGELTPTDVSYYVFPIYMIDDSIFEELLARNRKIMIYINDESDLATVVQRYNSEQTTALASQILEKLKFIVNQPILLEKLLPKP